MKIEIEVENPLEAIGLLSEIKATGDTWGGVILLSSLIDQIEEGRWVSVPGYWMYEATVEGDIRFKDTKNDAPRGKLMMGSEAIECVMLSRSSVGEIWFGPLAVSEVINVTFGHIMELKVGK